jgi:hypothetical protein
MNKLRTMLEGFLFWWLAANCLIFVVLLFLAAVLPSSVVKITLSGSTSLVLALMALIPILGAWAYLAWKMRAPTPRVLLFGAIFFLLAIVHIEWRSGLWSLNPVFAVRFTLLSNPSFVIQMDVVALVVSMLFAIAWRRRVMAHRNASENALNSGAS